MARQIGITNSLYPGVDKLDGIGGFLMQIGAAVTIGMESILNKQRGARTAPLSLLFFSVPLHIGLALLSAAIEPGSGEELIAMTITIIVANIFRRIEAWSRLRSGADDPYGTRFLGISVFATLAPILPHWFHAPFLDHWSAQRYTHPIICILAGIGILIVGDSIIAGSLLILNGIFMAWKAQILFETLVNSILDRYDATKEAHILPRLLEHRRNGAGAFDPGVPISGGLLDVLNTLPTSALEVMVAESSQSTNGKPAPSELRQQELFNHES